MTAVNKLLVLTFELDLPADHAFVGPDPLWSLLYWEPILYSPEKFNTTFLKLETYWGCDSYVSNLSLQLLTKDKWKNRPCCSLTDLFVLCLSVSSKLIQMLWSCILYHFRTTGCCCTVFHYTCFANVLFFCLDTYGGLKFILLLD